MSDFFKSGKFKILTAVLAVLIALMFVTAYLGGRASPLSQALGIVVAPLQKLSSNISGAASGFFEKFLSAQQLYDENIALREEIRELREQLVDFEEYKRENEHYREVLGLKEQNPEFTFEPAEVIGRDPNDRFYGFTIDKGSLNDVSVRDPVITPDGLVGWVSEVGLNYAKVSTILDVSVDVGAVDTRTRDSGVVTGDISLAAQGLCKLGYLPRESAVTAGDIIQTSGLSSAFGMVFPKGLIIGKVTEVRAEPSGIVLYAVIEPTAKITSVKDVFVLTSFPGQGVTISSEEDQEGTAGASGSGTEEEASSSGEAGPSGADGDPAASQAAVQAQPEGGLPENGPDTPAPSEDQGSPSSGTEGGG